MTQVEMPEPVGKVIEQTRVIHNKDGTYCLTPIIHGTAFMPTPGTLLITTDQAEAYADARVREALQVVAGTVEQYHPKATPKGIAAAIRLIASTDGLTAPPHCRIIKDNQ